MRRRRLFAWLLVALSSCSWACTVGYRHTRHEATFTRDDGRSLDISGGGHTARLGAALDFRYFRFVIPYEATVRLLDFEDENGKKDRADIVRERRLWRLDVPLLTVVDFGEGGVGYTGNKRHRHSLDVWIGGETDLMAAPEWWVDVSLAYYRYNGVGVRLYVGGGAYPFRATTQMPGSRFPFIFEGHAPMFGAGIEGTFTAGEFALDAVEWLLGVDRVHRERSRRYGWE